VKRVPGSAVVQATKGCRVSRANRANPRDAGVDEKCIHVHVRYLHGHDLLPGVSSADRAPRRAKATSPDQLSNDDDGARRVVNRLRADRPEQ
jgi:hypothetical protein